MIKYIFLTILFANVGLFHQDKTINIEVTPNYYGWVYLIPVKNIEKSTEEYIVKINKDGVANIQELGPEEELKIKVSKGSEDITNSIKFLSSTEISLLKEDKMNENKKMFKFYIPNKGEINKNISWGNIEIQKAYYKKEKLRREELIKKNKLIFN